MRNTNKSNSKALERFKPKQSQTSTSKKITLDKRLEEENLSPLLISLEELPKASFVEYLRWMRAFKIEDSEQNQNKAENNATKLHLLQLAQNSSIADYSKYFKRACKRLEHIVELKRGQSLKETCLFEVTCPWRIRVGGNRGPENILLPAFDALGMPFIPSSTLRGIARSQAIREVIKKYQITWKDAEKHETIISHFGSIEASDKANREGKVTFLDAYPLADNSSSGGLSLDIANNVWKWGDNNLPEYQPNPNLFLSLKKPTFLIGLIPNRHCKNGQLEQVKDWLIKGLAIGAGSQINSGYGCLTESGNYCNENQEVLLRLEFTLSGQLINSYKSYKIDSKTQKLKINASTKDNPEVRSIAFKSMLRYWFRVIALGVLPPQRVKELESYIFGGIEPNHRGLIQIQIHNTDDGQPPTEDHYGQQSGKLIILASPEVSSENHEILTDFIPSLTWLMCHLGGVGLGARRPLYDRNHRPKPPYWRGSNLEVKNQNERWSIPETIEDFQAKFHNNLRIFYTNLNQIQNHYIQLMQESKHDIKAHVIDAQCPLKVRRTKKCSWAEALDKNCRVLIYKNTRNNQNNRFQKGFALSLLHSKSLNKEELNKQGKNRFLCGEDGVPSPVCLASIGQYEIVTIFNATNKFFMDYQKKNRKVIKHNPRSRYFELLSQEAQILILWDGSGFESLT